MAEILLSLTKYLQERANLLIEMEMSVERRVRLDEINKVLDHFYTQLQKAKERGETW